MVTHKHRLSRAQRETLDVFRRFLSKGKSRTKAAFIELRQHIKAPRWAKDTGDYGIAVREWDADVAKLVSYRGSGTLPAQEDLLEA